MTTLLNETRFLLNNPAEAWQVQSGSVDLFLVDLRADGNTGPLFYVCSIAAPNTVRGVGSIELQSGVATLMCQLRSSTELLQISSSPELAEQWQATLLQAAELEPGDGVAVTPQSLLTLIAARRSATETSEAERLDRKHLAGAATIVRAFSQLTAGLQKKKLAVTPQELSTSAVFSACAAVGRELGIEMRMPRHFTASRDPIADVQNIARATNVRYRQVTLSGEWWKREHGPLLAFQQATDASPSRPVALLRRGESYIVYDPAGGASIPLTAALATEMMPAAMMFYRSFPARPLTWKDLIFFGLFDTRRDIAWVVLTGAAMGLLALVAPIATGILFDTIIPGAQRSQLFHMGVLLFMANMVTFLISLTSSAAMQRMEGRMEAGIQSAVWDRLLSLPARFFRDYNSGDLVTRSLAIGEIRKMLTGTALGSLMSGIFSLFSFALLFYYSSTLALVAAALTVFTALTSAFCTWLQMRYLRDLYKISTKLAGLVLEIMGGISKLRMSGTEPQAFARWAEPFSEQKSILRKAQRISMFASIFNGVFPTVAALCIFYFGFAMMEGQGTLSPGSFVAFNAAFGQFLGAALGLSGTLISIIGIVPAYEQARPIMQAVPETRAGRTDPGRLTGAIEASRLTFRYKDDLPIVLHDVSFEIRPGQFVAFVGHSGSGKSTLFRLLLGFEEAESGFIHFDGMDMRDIDPISLRRQMGVVLQNGRIFDGDIFTNIVGSAPLTLDDAWAAARASGLDQDIEAMPMGMHTVISEGGGGFSGGQRQRLLIARAIVQKPRILLFDEATSALDNQTQAIVSRSLEQLNATRVVIAHRLSTILKADQIFVFDEGRIVQRGTYEELMQQEGLFRELAKRQLA